MQAVIVPEVEQEVFTNPKHRGVSRPWLQKALSNGLIVRVSEDSLPGLRPDLDRRLIRPILDQADDVGAEYRRRVGRGEAYTHAMALALDAPSLSHDENAVRTLMQHGLAVPVTLRVFDLFVLCHQCGLISADDCDAYRKAIYQLGSEAMPSEFRRQSFEDGLSTFQVRAVDSTQSPICPVATLHLPLVPV